ncbi:hypothetical protein [Acinetobacter sp. YH12064]|uniref:hypothetical protein n=1 Tax=Acinetobacter sp. YH12064 TaxID=2601062 RepID=UPI0015D1A9FD|nr:hypothetical protein [Acinetobacter sp. YH12064]
MNIKRKCFEESNNVNPDWSFKFDEELQQYIALDSEMELQVDEFNEHWDTFRAGWEAKAQTDQKIKSLLCDEHLKKCESPTGVFNSQYPDEEPCLICLAKQAKAQAVPEEKGRSDFEIIAQTIELVDLIAGSNCFQRDKSMSFPFESNNPRNIEWWRLACKIQELLTDTDPDNCDFEEYKAMIEAQEQGQ